MTTFTPPSIEELQRNFPQYKIESFIAQGGMGAVYLARQVSLDRPVAIKILPDEFGEDADYRASFETEAKAMARLNHSNLVGIFDFGEINGMLFIVMEYIPGRSLFDTANGKQVEQKEAARLIADMSEGLAHAHDAGMLHRDIKPANVLIDDQARPKIVDFGLARPMGEEQTDGVVFGTPGYTAPEVLSNPYAVDHRSDIFSMGVMLYELLTGKLPGSPVIPASRISDADSRFDTIISKSIHPNPAMRYKSADKLSEDLDQLIKKFDEPKAEQRKASPLLAAKGAGTTAGAKRPVAGLSRGVGGSSASVALPSAKRSQSGMIILTLLILVALGGLLAVKMMNSEPEGPSLAEQAAAKKKAELEKAIEEKKRKAAAERKRKKELKAKKEREAERQAQLEDEQAERERQQQEEQRKKREERERAEKEAAMLAEKEAARLAAEKAVSQFDTEKFIQTERSLVKEKLDAIDDRTNELLEPIFDKLERELKRKVRKFAKGKKGQLAREAVEEYMVSVREEGNITELPKAVHHDLRKEADVVLAEYKLKRDEAVDSFNEDKEAVLKSYLEMLKKKQDELNELNDKEGAKSLDPEIEEAKELESFLKLFAGEE